MLISGTTLFRQSSLTTGPSSSLVVTSSYNTTIDGPRSGRHGDSGSSGGESLLGLIRMLMPERILDSAKDVDARDIRIGAMVVAALGAILTVCGYLAPSPDFSRKQTLCYAYCLVDSRC